VDKASVTLSVVDVPSAVSVLQVKFGSPLGELNVYVSRSDQSRLQDVRSTQWASGKSVKLGTVLGMPAWWSVDRDSLTVLVGEDDEAWDVAFSVPVAILSDLERQWAAI
jgi:hypothetical protein